MRTALIVYASSYGQTEKIAGYMAGRLRAQGVAAQALHVDATEPQPSFERFDAVFIGASLYVGRYQRGLRTFIGHHREALNAHPNVVFFSVSASAARAEGRTAVDDIMTAFQRDLGWQPGRNAQLAGAVKYPRYGWFTRGIMRRISRKEGGGLDTHREYEYTNWDEVDALVD